jgi:hypothetical protein
MEAGCRAATIHLLKAMKEHVRSGRPIRAVEGPTHAMRGQRCTKPRSGHVATVFTLDAMNEATARAVDTVKPIVKGGIRLPLTRTSPQPRR